MKSLSLKASCLCGGIKFKTEGSHRDVQNCHCIQCMKTHGHYAAYTKIEEQNIKFINRYFLWFSAGVLWKDKAIMVVHIGAFISIISA